MTASWGHLTQNPLGCGKGYLLTMASAVPSLATIMDMAVFALDDLGGAGFCRILAACSPARW